MVAGELVTRIVVQVMQGPEVEKQQRIKTFGSKPSEATGGCLEQSMEPKFSEDILEPTNERTDRGHENKDSRAGVASATYVTQTITM